MNNNNNIWEIFRKNFSILSKVPDGLKWAGAVLTGIAGITGAYSGLSTTVIHPLYDKLFPSFPSNDIVFVSSDQLTANSYLNLLALKGWHVRYLNFNQIDHLLDYKPGIVIVGGTFSKNMESLQLNAPVKRYLSSNVKILGMGYFGAQFLQAAFPESRIGANYAAHGFKDSVVLDGTAPKEILGMLPDGKSINLYSSGSDNTLD